MFKTLSRLVSVLALAAPLAANATLFDFTTTLKGSNEVPGILSAATGFAALQYNDGGTVGMGDDSFFVLIGASGLTGTPSGWHIHGAATTTENGPVRVNVGAFLGGTAGPGTLVSGGLISASNPLLLPLFSVPVTSPSGSNAGHPAMSFLSMLQSHLAYVNVHTPGPGGFPGGEVRGQLLQVTVVPEPETYAMLLAGLALIGSVVVRRRSKA